MEAEERESKKKSEKKPVKNLFAKNFSKLKQF